MAQSEVAAPAELIERNLRLTHRVTQFLLDHPALFHSLPDRFELVILPDDDPEIRSYNLDLLDKHGSQDNPVVFVRLNAHPSNLAECSAPRIFVPIPA